MKAHDFIYDNKKLSDFGFMICRFGGSGGMETISNGTSSTFHTISTLSGKKYEMTSFEYEEPEPNTIQICKIPCNNNVMEVSPTEVREITKWLGRNKFLKLKILDEHYIDLYFEARFKISRMEMDGVVYGFELEVETNRPFALHDLKTITITNTVENGKHSIHDTSHEEGYIYPYTEILVNQSGDLDIYNAIEDRSTHINNCVAGEIITMDYPIIQSSESSHYIQDDFNWNFFRIANTYENSKNDLTISIPCTIKIEYSPIVKVGL